MERVYIVSKLRDPMRALYAAIENRAANFANFERNDRPVNAIAAIQ